MTGMGGKYTVIETITTLENNSTEKRYTISSNAHSSFLILAVDAFCTETNSWKRIANDQIDKLAFKLIVEPHLIKAGNLKEK